MYYVLCNNTDKYVLDKRILTAAIMFSSMFNAKTFDLLVHIFRAKGVV